MLFYFHDTLLGRTSGLFLRFPVLFWDYLTKQKPEKKRPYNCNSLSMYICACVFAIPAAGQMCLLGANCLDPFFKKNSI